MKISACEYYKGSCDIEVVFASKQFGEYTAYVIGKYCQYEPITLEIVRRMAGPGIDVNGFGVRTGKHGLKIFNWTLQQIRDIVEWAEFVGFWQVLLWPVDEKQARGYGRLKIFGLEPSICGTWSIEFFDEDAVFMEYPKTYAFGKANKFLPSPRTI